MAGGALLELGNSLFTSKRRIAGLNLAFQNHLGDGLLGSMR